MREQDESALAGGTREEDGPAVVGGNGARDEDGSALANCVCTGNCGVRCDENKLEMRICCACDAAKLVH